MPAIATVLAAGCVAFAPLSAQQEAATNPIEQFLEATDNNDFDAMRALLADDLRWVGNKKINPDIFLERIGNCYLRRVYGDNIQKSLIAAWMCGEGKGKSRVVLGNLGASKKGKVLVGVTLEQRNDIPAPPRTGSAFAEEKAGKSE